MRDSGFTTPQRFDDATILMLDFVGLTDMAVSRDPTALITELNDIFTVFDRIVEHFGCDRMKTIGDADLGEHDLKGFGSQRVYALVGEASARAGRASSRIARVHEWLESARDHIAAAAGVEAAELDLTDEDIGVLLELARVAAHESGDRRNAPLVCFLLGVAVGRGSDLELERLAGEAAGSAG